MDLECIYWLGTTTLILATYHDIGRVTITNDQQNENHFCFMN